MHDNQAILRFTTETWNYSIPNVSGQMHTGAFMHMLGKCSTTELHSQPFHFYKVEIELFHLYFSYLPFFSLYIGVHVMVPKSKDACFGICKTLSDLARMGRLRATQNYQ
jgi:hypothetical protein